MSSTVMAQSSSPISSSFPTTSPIVASINQSEMRGCSRCKRGQIPTHERWKSCTSCREKSRNCSKRCAATRVALATMTVPNDNGAPASEKRKERDDEDMTDRLDGMKKKMRKHFKEKPIGTPNDPSTTVNNISRNSDSVEYQTATDMYKVLKSSRPSPMIQFRGCFSIVAVAKIDHERREQLVVKELRKIAKWSFDHDNPESTKRVDSKSNTVESVTTLYHCTCRKSPPVPAVQTTSTRPNSLLAALATGTVSAPLKRRQSDLMQWVKKKESASPSDAAATATCKGKLMIYVEEDTSHPVKGIKGQKVTVTIEH